MSKSRALVYHNLATLLAAGVPLIRSLKTISQGHHTFNRTFARIADHIIDGSTFSEALQYHTSTFPHLDIRVIDAGEQSGNLDQAVKLLAEWYEFNTRLRRQLITGLTLPALLLVAAAVISPLPFFIIGRMNTQEFLSSVFGTLSLFIVPALIIIGILKFTPATGPLRLLLDTLLLRIPVLSRALRHNALGRFAWAFHMLYRAGIPAGQAARIAAEVTPNAFIRRQLLPAARSAENGHPLYLGFSSHLPAEFRDAWQIGEESGRLEDATRRLASSHLDSAEFHFHQFNRWLPRIIYALVALLIIRRIVEGYANLPTLAGI